MALEQARLLLQRCEAAQRELHCRAERQEQPESELPAAVLLPYLIDSRQKHKLLGRQLLVLDCLLSLLETLDPSALEDSPPTPDTGSSVRAQWKALKSQYEQELAEVQVLLSLLQDRMVAVLNKKEALGQLLLTLEHKKEEMKEKQRIKGEMAQHAQESLSARLQELQGAVVRGQDSLRVSEQRVSQLQEQLDTAHQDLDTWTQRHSSLLQELMQLQGLAGVRLLSMSEDELSVELSPAALSPGLQLQPLRLSLRWASPGHFTVELRCAELGLPEQAVTGDLRAALLDLLHLYLSQGCLLAEIQRLHSQFAIDWRPAERKLLFLKTASVVCSLEVGEGYPSKAGVQLLSVQGVSSQAVNIDALRPPQQDPSLSEWLEYLSSCPDV
ncbi:ZW10 interactor isoform X2 [Amia ocellicauda]|uniref:ZW10 interactor isoform X2 n=1 Tax=Amia ocellicauda TaxID=2972642 RepID=UPI00346432F0